MIYCDLGHRLFNARIISEKKYFNQKCLKPINDVEGRGFSPCRVSRSCMYKPEIGPMATVEMVTRWPAIETRSVLGVKQRKRARTPGELRLLQLLPLRYHLYSISSSAFQHKPSQAR